MTLLLLGFLPPISSMMGVRGQQTAWAAIDAAFPWLVLLPILLTLRVAWPVRAVGGVSLVTLAVLNAMDAWFAYISLAALCAGWLSVSLAWFSSQQIANRPRGCRDDH
ncbi:MAG: hypothetical protein IT318_16595 [Anaerolineales bacterium]|nr:hypothetical protein [Anaerolineales bacterium]